MDVSTEHLQTPRSGRHTPRPAGATAAVCGLTMESALRAVRTDKVERRGEDTIDMHLRPFFLVLVFGKV